MTDTISKGQARTWPSRVGFVGLGRMGTALASNLLEDGHELVVYDRKPRAGDALAAKGAKVARRIDDLNACDLVLTSVADDEALAAVTLGDGGLLQALSFGGIHLSLSTVSPTLSYQLEAVHAERGQTFVAAPVLGNPDLAATRKLFVILSGAHDARTLVQPMLERMAERVFVVGTSAADAALLKLAGNLLTAATLQSMSEVLALVRKAGIAPETAFDLFTGSLFDGKVHKTYGGKVLAQHYTPPGMTLPLAVKDLRLALAQAEDLSVPMPMASLIHERLVEAVALGWSGLDWSALGLLAARDAGIDDAIPSAPLSAEGARTPDHD